MPLICIWAKFCLEEISLDQTIRKDTERTGHQRWERLRGSGPDSVYMRSVHVCVIINWIDDCCTKICSLLLSSATRTLVSWMSRHWRRKCNYVLRNWMFPCRADNRAASTKHDSSCMWGCFKSSIVVSKFLQSSLQHAWQSKNYLAWCYLLLSNSHKAEWCSCQWKLTAEL